MENKGVSEEMAKLMVETAINKCRSVSLTEDRVNLMLNASIDARIAELVRNMESKMRDLESRLCLLIDRKLEGIRDLINNAFPNGDVYAHKMEHERIQESKQRKATVLSDIVTRVSSTALWAFVVWVAFAVFTQLKGYLFT